MLVIRQETSSHNNQSQRARGKLKEHHSGNCWWLGNIGNLIYNHWKFLLGPQECPVIFLLLWYQQPAEAYNCKAKICYVGKQWLPKKSTGINNFLPLSDIYLTQCGTRWGYTFTSTSGEHRIMANKCSKPSTSRHIIFKMCFSPLQ